MSHLKLFLLLLTLLGCSPAGSGAVGPPAPRPGLSLARAAPLDVPAADIAVPGRLLAIKDGSIVQWSQGAFKPLVGGERYQSPTFSPDGKRISASIVGDNHSDLVLLDASGRRLVRLTDNWSKARVQDSVWARHPTWSPDGRQIVYVSDALGSQMSLWSVDPAGASRRQVFPAPGWGGVDWPSWSPDGRDLALTVYDLSSSQLARVNLTLGSLNKLAEHVDGAYDPAWSPDGEHIAYVVRTAGRDDVWIMDSDGADPIRLTDVGTARAPAWSPGGDLIAFIAEQDRSFDLYVVQPNLSHPTLVSSSALKRLTTGQTLDAPSGVSWTR